MNSSNSQYIKLLNIEALQVVECFKSFKMLFLPVLESFWIQIIVTLLKASRNHSAVFPSLSPQSLPSLSPCSSSGCATPSTSSSLETRLVPLSIAPFLAGLTKVLPNIRVFLKGNKSLPHLPVILSASSPVCLSQIIINQARSIASYCISKC